MSAICGQGLVQPQSRHGVSTASGNRYAQRGFDEAEQPRQVQGTGSWKQVGTREYPGKGQTPGKVAALSALWGRQKTHKNHQMKERNRIEATTKLAIVARGKREKKDAAHSGVHNNARRGAGGYLGYSCKRAIRLALQAEHQGRSNKGRQALAHST